MNELDAAKKRKIGEDDETAKSDRRLEEDDRSASRHGGKPRVRRGVVRTVDVTLSPPSAAGGARRTATIVRRRRQ